MSGERGGASPTRFLSEPDVRGLFQNYKEIESYPAVGERRRKKSLNLQMFILELSFVSSKQLRSW